MTFKSYWIVAFLIFTVRLCFADDDHEMEEFLKREYSLSKPYQGIPPIAVTVTVVHRDELRGTDVSRMIHSAFKHLRSLFLYNR